MYKFVPHLHLQGLIREKPDALNNPARVTFKGIF